MAKSVKADANGNVYVAGYYAGTARIFNGIDSTILPATNGSHAFLAKFSSVGHLIWVKTIMPTNPAGYASDESNAVALDASGNVYWGAMANSFTATVGGTSQTFTSMGALDIMVAKLTPSGDYTWIKTFGSTGKEQVYALVPDVSGNIFLTGSTAGEIDFDPGVAGGELLKVGTNDLFVLSLTSSGAFRWVMQGGVAKKTYVGRGLAADPSGNVYVTGEYVGDGNFGGVTVATAAGKSPFVLKLSNAGVVTWAKSYPGNFDSYGNGIAVDKAGNVYSVGALKGTYDFDPSSATKNLVSNGGTSNFDGYVAKLNKDGNYVWAVALSSTLAAGYDECKAITIDKDDNMYVTGSFTGILDFDLSTSGSYPFTSRGGRDIFVTKMDADNKFIWAYQLGGTNTNNEEGNSVFVDNSYNVFTTGAYRSVADFSLIPASPVTMTTASLNTVGFLHKVSQRFCTPTSSSLAFTVCDSIRVNGQKYTTGGTYIQTLVNSAGCDSTISLNLTINHSVTGSNITHTTCDSFVFGNTTYKTTGVYPHTLNTAAGCDSIVMLNLTINKSAHTMLTEQACASYTIDTATYTETGIYDYLFMTSAGCDSMVTLDLTILNTRDTITEASCFSFTSATNTYTRSGFYTETYQNTAGCDSVVVIDLTIDTVDNSVSRSGLTLSANEAGATYQWIDCDSPANVLLNAAQQTFLPAHDGSYAVVVTLGDCTDTSACHAVTGIDENESVGILSVNGFRAYPNPIGGELYITVSGTLRQASFRLTNITGQILMEANNLSGSNLAFDVNGLVPGMYIAELREGAQISRVKLTKE